MMIGKEDGTQAAVAQSRQQHEVRTRRMNCKIGRISRAASLEMKADSDSSSGDNRSRAIAVLENSFFVVTLTLTTAATAAAATRREAQDAKYC